MGQGRDAEGTKAAGAPGVHSEHKLNGRWPHASYLLTHEEALIFDCS